MSRIVRVSLVVAALMLAGLSAAPVSATRHVPDPAARTADSAVPARGAVANPKLAIAPNPAGVGEPVTFSGRLATRIVRPVVVQVNRDGRWRTRERARTKSSGRFSISHLPSTAGFLLETYRVMAPAHRASGRRYARVVTRQEALTVTGQRAEVSFVGGGREVVEGAHVALRSGFVPVRPGRPTRLEQRDGTGRWVTIASASQDGAGLTAWNEPLRLLTSNGQETIRVVAAATSRLPEVASPEQTVSVHPAAEVWSGNQRCRDVLFVGARGSGQALTSGFGLGDEVHGAWTEYRAALTSGADAGFYAVRYQAAPVDWLLPWSGQVEAYFDSIDSGVEQMAAYIRSRASDCPGEHYVLAGYSQGAIAVHRTLWDLIDDGTVDHEVLDRIDGLLAIADPDRMATQGGRHYGSASIEESGGNGAAHGARPFRDDLYDAQARAIPGSFGDRFHDVCLRGDVICAPLNADPGSVGVHGVAYRSNGRGAFAGMGVGDVRDAARAMAASHNAADPEIATTGLPDAEIDVAYDQRLESADGRAGRWTVSSGNLPPGLQVTAEGRIAGSSSGPAGTYPFTVRFVDRHQRSATRVLTLRTTPRGAGTGAACAEPATIPVVECAALAAIRNANPDRLSHWATGDPCGWTGVGCTGGHVTELTLAWTGLSTVPAELGDLAELRSLDLGWNSLTTVPGEIGDLVELRSLSLVQNALTSVPAEIGNLARLETLNLALNQFTVLPATMSNLTNLRYLHLFEGRLSGNVASWAKALSLSNPTMTLGLWGNECLDAGGDTDLASWLTARDSGWRDGCA